jgi:hypothetical protein
MVQPRRFAARKSPTSSSADSGNASTPSPPAPRAELLHVLMLPDFERADRIGEFWGYPESGWSEARPSACGYRGDPFRTK